MRASCLAPDRATFGMETGDVEGAVRLAEVDDHRTEDLHRVGHGPAVPRVQRLMEALHLHVHLTDRSISAVPPSADERSLR
jgi:hypothetical protein